MLYCWLTFRHPSLKYAILAGLMVGFSIWTKNGALLIFISILLFFLVQRFMKRSALLGSEVGSFHLRYLMIILLISSAIGGPWYMRNHLLYQYFAPTGWVAKGWWASYGIPFLAPFRAMGYHFSALYVFGMIYGSYRLLKKDTKILFLFSFIFPYLIVWLLKFNYDTRFLFMILTPFVILGVWSVVECFKKALDELVRKEVIAVVMGGFLVLPHLGYAIAKNRDLFSGPSLSDDEKRLEKMGRFYPLVLYFKDLQSKGEKNIRIVTGESRLIYFLNYHSCPK